MPGHLLRRCHQISVAIFLDECQAFDLTPLQFSVLAALSSYGALDKATLSRVAALDRTTVSVVLKNLQERGFVASRASDQDRRATLNDITEDGLATLRAAQSDVVRAQERMLAPLNEDERVEFLRLLAKMADANNMFSRAPQRTPKA
ncbi:MarR family transcriptional regulator [Rhodovastum atsumiense]|uniref:MarR family transcriptional regulator n=2 Tax=Rhodovastum atsumiense TaxID=504468 RepID=A0A5M6IQT5_9PROT|nr:MarR family transcriptional regulator [Rhodovastum atsumiense]